MSKRGPIPAKDAADAFQDVLSRGFQAFAYYHWWSLEKSNPSFATDTTCITIRNAALESSLMSIRDLDDFFLSSPNARSDDLIASDYGFPAGRNFFTVSEREAINKKLAHITYRALHELRADPLRANPRTWNNADLVKRAMDLLLEFMDHLESSFFANDKVQLGFIHSARTMTLATLKNMNNIARQEMDFTSDPKTFTER